MILYASGIMWLAASLQGVTGFGFMLLAIPGLILWLPAQVVVPALILVWIPLGTVQVLHLPEGRRLEIAGPPSRERSDRPSIGGGHPPGDRQAVDAARYRRDDGGDGITSVCESRVAFSTSPAREDRCRLISGVLAASTSAAGPPVAFLGLKQRWETARFRATLPAYFVAISLCCLPLHWEMDLLGRPSIEVAVSGLPGVVVGYLTGIWLKGRVGGEGFRWVVLAMVMEAGSLR